MDTNTEALFGIICYALGLFLGWRAARADMRHQQRKGTKR